MAATAIPFYSLGVFVAPLEAATGWSRADISFAATLIGFCLPLSLLVAGHLIDRLGVRAVAASGHFILGLAFLLLAMLEGEIWLFWLMYAMVGLLAAGASPITFTRALVGLFDRQRGIAIGICLSGAGLGAAIAPPLLSATIERFGWPAGYLALGLLSWCLVPVALRWLPKQGAIAPAAAARPARTSHDGRSATVNAMLLGGICVAFFAVALSVNGYVVHLVPLLIDSGVGATRAAWLGSLLGVAVIAGRLVTGLLLDRMAVGLLGGVVFFMAAAGILVLDVIGAQAAPASAFLIGLTLGAEVDLVAYLVSRTFSPADYARRFSKVYSAFMLGSGLSPFAAGWIADRDASYALFIRFSGVVLAIVGTAFLVLHLLQRRGRDGNAGLTHASDQAL